MGQITADQSQAVMAALATNTKWSEIDFEKCGLQDSVLRDGQSAGQRFVRFLQNGGRFQIISTDGIVPPKGGMARMLTVPVNEARAWQEAIDAAGPNTPKDYNVRKVGDQYPPLVGTTERLEEIWVVNSGRGRITPSLGTIAWGKKQRLIPASPRACFAIAEHLPKLPTYLGMDPMAVVSLRECSFGGRQFCRFVWFRGARREASLNWLEDGWNDYCWFAFVRELGPGTLES